MPIKYKRFLGVFQTFLLSCKELFMMRKFPLFPVLEFCLILPPPFFLLCFGL